MVLSLECRPRSAQKQYVLNDAVRANTEAKLAEHVIGQAEHYKGQLDEKDKGLAMQRNVMLSLTGKTDEVLTVRNKSSSTTTLAQSRTTPAAKAPPMAAAKSASSAKKSTTKTKKTDDYASAKKSGTKTTDDYTIEEQQDSEFMPGDGVIVLKGKYKTLTSDSMSTRLLIRPILRRPRFHFICTMQAFLPRPVGLDQRLEPSLF